MPNGAALADAEALAPVASAVWVVVVALDGTMGLALRGAGLDCTVVLAPLVVAGV